MSESKKVIFISGILKNGGVAKHVSVISKELTKKGFKAVFLLTVGVDDDVYFDYGEGSEIVSLPEYCKKVKDSKLYEKNVQSIERQIGVMKKASRFFGIFSKNHETLNHFKRSKLRKCAALRTFLQQNDGSVLIPFGIEYYTLAYFAKKGTRCKIVFAERNSPQIENYDETRKFCNGKCLKKADWAIFQTKEEADYYKNELAGKTSVIHNPISSTLPEKYNGKRKHEIVNFCRLSKQKNLPLLIDAFAAFSKNHSDYSLLIYGNTVCESEETLKTELENYIADIGMREKIFILPPRADVCNVAKDCAMFVSSSDFEGLSNSMIEALSVGLPTICTDCLGGGARECIENEVNGLLTPIGDVRALSDAMCRFADDEELAEKCAIEGYKTRQRLSADSICEKWIEVIEKVLGR